MHDVDVMFEQWPAMLNDVKKASRPTQCCSRGGGGVCYLGLPCVACHAVLVVVLHCSSPAIRY